MPNILTFSLPTQTPGYLTISLKNVSGGLLDRPLTIEFYLPTDVVAEALDKAAIKAAGCDPPSKSLEGVVTGTGPCSVWAKPDRSPKMMIVMLCNDLKLTGVVNNCETNEQIDPPATLAAGTELTILIPLHADAAKYQTIDIPYTYEYGDQGVLGGKLKLESASTDEWKPDVWLKSNQTNPTAIEPMDKVIISWHIGSGVHATLRGPLANGNAEVTLSDSSSSTYKMTDGSFEFKATGRVSYLLQAEVKRPDGKPPNVQVMKAITLDIQTGKENGYLQVFPRDVLPFGPVKIDWAAWGVDDAKVIIGNVTWEITLTDLTVNREYMGSGLIPTTAGEPSGSDPLITNVILRSQVKKRVKDLATTTFNVIPWRKMNPSQFQGQPIGVAVSAPHMALLTTAGLWIADDIGIDDLTPQNYGNVTQVTFKPVAATDRTKAWLALAALDKDFVVLRQNERDELEVARYSHDGTPVGNPVGFSTELRPLVQAGANVDLAVYGRRVYVVVETRTGSSRRAFSLSFPAPPATTQQPPRAEPLLEGLPGYRLVNFDNALYAIHRDSGRLLQLPLKPGSTLDLPRKAAPAVAKPGGPSMIKEGQLVPVGRVLAVLGPSSLPPLNSQTNTALRNVLTHRRVGPLRNPNTFAQDIVYNPQEDSWMRCGRGLQVKPGMVLAYRGGKSQRLWAIEPATKDTHTLTISSEQLFADNYLPRNEALKLPAYFEKKREFMFINNTRMKFVPLNETCAKAGLLPFSATTDVALATPLPTGADPAMPETVELHYNEADRPQVTLRFRADRGPGINHEYVLEVTLFGLRFSNSTICFKRVTPNAQGGVSVTEMPGKLEGAVALGLIERFPRELTNGIRLRIRNLTPYTLWLRSPSAPNVADQEKKYEPDEVINIKYNTPPFSLYAHGVGELPVDVDFALPKGIEMSPGTEAQKVRLRIRHNYPRSFEIDSFSCNETSEYDAYEFTLSYRVQKTLQFGYLGDGVPSKDGATIYLPVAQYDSTNAKILTIDANTLQLGKQADIEERKNIFSRPNSVAVLSDMVLAIVNGKHLKVFDHELRPKPGIPLQVFEYDVITHLKGSPNDSAFYLLGMKEQPGWQFPHSFRFDCFNLSATLRKDSYRIMDFFKMGRRSRVPGAAPWVAPNTVSPMDVRPGGVMAICVEGGVIGVELGSDKEIDVNLPGTGNEVAILVDRTENLIFCAHTRTDGNSLMISRINLANPREILTRELGYSMTYMNRDSRTPPTQSFEYNRQIAVSLIATSDALFVSHQTKIYLLDKTTLSTRKWVTLNLPSRLIQVRRGKPPGENHSKYGSPQECYLMWGIAARYFGDGQTVTAEDYGKYWDTVLYKIALVP